MEWKQVPEFKSSASLVDDNHFAGSRTQLTGKVSVNVLEDEWLCRKMEKLNVTIMEGYPLHNLKPQDLAEISL